MKVIAFAATNSIKSINKQFAQYATKFIDGKGVEIIDINDFDLPIYSSDLEEKFGVPEAANAFLSKISEADALLISYAEHNGGYTVAYKNLFDWASRINMKVYQNKPVVMLSTSPGASGASRVLKTAIDSAHFFDGNVVASMSLPGFYENFNSEAGELTDDNLKEQLKRTVGAINQLA